MAPAILYEQRDGIVVITMNRPEALNSINRELRDQMTEALERYDTDDSARVAIITGAGRAFCAGRDLKERAEDNAAGVQAKGSDSLGTDTLGLFPRTWKPLIAAINGYAMAGGWAIAQMCDLRVAAEDAQMGISESRWSLLPPFAASLPKLIPMANVLELVFTGQPITAQRAYEIGFINRVVPQDQLMNEATALAARLVEMAPLSLKYFKEIAYRGVEMNEAGLTSMTRNIYDMLLQSEDAKEGPQAFAEKRQPTWKGR